MKIEILAISDGDKDFGPLINEYMKRLDKQVTITHVKPTKHGSIEQIIKQDTTKLTEKVISRQQKVDALYLLSKEGSSLRTKQFAQLAVQGSCLFVIGGPYGLDESRLLPYLTGTISFGQQTMAHALTKTVLLEQLRRTHCITTNRPYHY